MDVEQLRAWLPVTRDVAYLNTGWAGPSPEPVLRAITEAMGEEARLGPASAKGLAFVERTAEAARSAIAALIGASAQDVRLTSSTTEGVNVVVHNLDWQQGDGLVICDLAHPALIVPAQLLEDRRGVAVERVTVPPAATQAEVLEAVNAALGPRTRLVALSHIQFSGLRMPVKEIIEAAHRQGVSVLLDGAQTVGQIPVDVDELGCDFYTLSGQKWLMGPQGTGALYIRPESLSLLTPPYTTREIEAGIHAVGPLDEFAVASQSPGLAAGLAEAVRLPAETGLDVIEQRVMGLADLLRHRIASVPGATLLSPSVPESACGLVTVRLEGWAPVDLVALLQQRFGIVARDMRYPEGVRFTTAYFNTEEEIEHVAVTLTELAA